MQNNIDFFNDLSKSNIIPNVYLMFIFQMKIKQNYHSFYESIESPNIFSGLSIFAIDSVHLFLTITFLIS